MALQSLQENVERAYVRGYAARLYSVARVNPWQHWRGKAEKAMADSWTEGYQDAEAGRAARLPVTTTGEAGVLAAGGTL